MAVVQPFVVPEPSAARVAAPVATTKPRGRVIELDILRGFLLLWMALTHLPTKASIISNQTFGFVSGAEGFIFLAAFMVGTLEYRVGQTRGELGSLRDVLRRTFRIYAYHIALLAVAFTLVARVGVSFHRLALENLLSFYLQSPHQAVAAGAILAYCPSLFDILPLYVIFMLLTPVARAVARRSGWDVVIYASLAVWVAAQFGLRHWVYVHVTVLGLGVPENSTGAFDIWGWQFLWMVGLALGNLYADNLSGATLPPGRRSTIQIPEGLLRLSVVLAVVLCILRYSPVYDWIDPDLYGWLIDKWRLGPMRVVNFTVLAILLVHYGRRIAAWPFMKPLAALGQASIEVFSVHVLCCLGGHALSADADPSLPAWQQVLLLVVTITALFATAHIQRRRVAGRRLRRALAAA